MKVGVLALQGASELHRRVLDNLGVASIAVRYPDDLADVERLIVPGGESTTMSMMLERNELFEPLADRLAEGMAVFGTCAGMILLADEIVDGREDQRSFGSIDIDVRRNAFGRQIDSFETDLDVAGLSGDPFPAVFIRAPIVERAGADVDVLAEVGGRPVLCGAGQVMVAAFHPELSDDMRLHERFLDL